MILNLQQVLFFICRMQKYGLSVTRAFAHETQVFNYVNNYGVRS